MAMKLNKAKSTDGKGLIQHYTGLSKARKHVTVGVQPDAADYEDGTAVLEVAVAGEFGNARARVRPRHFLSLAVTKDKAYYEAKIKKVLKFYTKGNIKLVEIGLTEIGRQSVLKVQHNIENNTIGMAPNAENTIRAKGGDQPMIDTGHLVRQIDYRLEK